MTATHFSTEDWQTEIAKRDQTIFEQDQKIIYLEQQLEWLKKQIFGKKSERTVADLAPGEQWLPGFEELFTPAEPDEEEEAGIVPEHKRRKRKKKGQDAIKLDPDLPVRTTVLDIPEEEKICKETGMPLVQIGEEVSRKLVHEPGSYYIKEIVRPKYVSPARPEAGITTALLPDSILPKCLADDSLLAEIIVQKFANHMPLNRHAEQMGRDGVTISHKLLSQWVVKCGFALKPLYKVMVQKILSSENVYIDESPVKLLDKGKCKTAYMWVIVGGCEANPPYRIYDFREDRKHEHAKDILKGYQGTLHSDKYAAYERLAEKKEIHWCPCWSHVRRKFFEAESTDPQLRSWILRKIRYLFMLERVAWTRSPEQRLQIRQEKEAPIIDELTEKIQNRLAEGSILPKSKFRTALGYYSGLIPYLKNYTLRPFARLDNNVAERAIRPLTVGRKNWLFFGSESGGEAGAILLSFVQTCRGLKINPRQYLEDVFRRLMGHSANRLEELLPDQWLAAKTASEHPHPSRESG
jgi:transposase